GAEEGRDALDLGLERLGPDRGRHDRAAVDARAGGIGHELGVSRSRRRIHAGGQDGRDALGVGLERALRDRPRATGGPDSGGDGTTTDRTDPVQVGTDTNWASVSGGDSHTIALKTDGTVWGWGWNGFGPLGEASTAPQNTPQLIP